jgi:broad specificity phosphatase PhoE
MKFIFIRHGESVGNVYGRTDGREKQFNEFPERVMGLLNWHLSEKGLRDAKELGKTIKIKPKNVFVSPLIRTTETAKAIFGDKIECIVDERIVERCVEYFDHFSNSASVKERNELFGSVIIEYMSSLRHFDETPYDCESTKSVIQRLLSFVSEKSGTKNSGAAQNDGNGENNEDGEVVCVSHNMVMVCLQMILRGEVENLLLGNLMVMEFTDTEFYAGIKRLEETVGQL